MIKSDFINRIKMKRILDEGEIEIIEKNAMQNFFSKIKEFFNNFLNKKKCFKIKSEDKKIYRICLSKKNILYIKEIK